MSLKNKKQNKKMNIAHFCSQQQLVTHGGNRKIIINLELEDAQGNYSLTA
jgi:hypothetical protein